MIGNERADGAATRALECRGPVKSFWKWFDRATGPLVELVTNVVTMKALILAEITRIRSDPFHRRRIEESRMVMPEPAAAPGEGA
eukprot:14974172-Alexandrium_andersonii.AAC.1